MEESELLKKRKEKIESLKADGIDLYPNDVKVTATTESILTRFGNMESDAIALIDERFTLTGRLVAVRKFGKAAFANIQDRKRANSGIYKKGYNRGKGLLSL